MAVFNQICISGKNGSIYYWICCFGALQFLIFGLGQFVFNWHQNHFLQQILYYQELSLKNLTWINITERIEVYRYMSEGSTILPPDLEKRRRNPKAKEPCLFPPKGLGMCQTLVHLNMICTQGISLPCVLTTESIICTCICKGFRLRHISKGWSGICFVRAPQNADALQRSVCTLEGNSYVHFRIARCAPFTKLTANVHMDMIY